MRVPGVAGLCGPSYPLPKTPDPACICFQQPGTLSSSLGSEGHPRQPDEMPLSPQDNCRYPAPCHEAKGALSGA